ncbi:hypothetical protein F5Y04DRAFT_242641, partial [Hypomontagnella monticulosa]
MTRVFLHSSCSSQWKSFFFGDSSPLALIYSLTAVEPSNNSDLLASSVFCNSHMYSAQFPDILRTHPEKRKYRMDGSSGSLSTKRRHSDFEHPNTPPGSTKPTESQTHIVPASLVDLNPLSDPVASPGSNTPSDSSMEPMTFLDTGPKPPELAPNRTDGWLQDLDPTQSPEQARSEVYCASIVSLYSASTRRSLDDSQRSTSKTSSVENHTYLPVILKGARVFLIDHLLDEPFPPHIEAASNKLLNTVPLTTFPDELWKPRHATFLDELAKGARINESDATYALCAHHDIAIISKEEEFGLNRTFKARWPDHSMPVNPKNTRARLSTPEPDITFGFKTYALPEMHDCPYIYTQQYTYFVTSACLYFPYFMVEVKAPSQSEHASLNEILTSSSSGIKVSGQVIGGDDLYVYALHMDTKTASFYVMWMSGDKYVGKKFKDILLSSYEGFLECRGIIYNIHAWAAQKRRPLITKALNIIEASGRPTSDNAVSQQELEERSRTGQAGPASRVPATAQLAIVQAMGMRTVSGRSESGSEASRTCTILS